MRYIYTLGPWRELNGYVFCNGNPTEVVDRATLERIKREAGFQEVVQPAVQPKETENGEVQEGQVQADAAPVLKPKFDRSEWMKRMHAEGRMKKK